MKKESVKGDDENDVSPKKYHKNGHAGEWNRPNSGFDEEVVSRTGNYGKNKSPFILPKWKKRIRYHADKPAIGCFFFMGGKINEAGTV